jgi:hypothetical protein
MVFYIIAAAEKDSSVVDPSGKINYKDEATVINKIKSSQAFQDRRTDSTQLHTLKVRLSFK